MAGTPMPYVKIQFFTDAGAIASGYHLFTYAAGTTTKQATYTDVALTTPNANPIVLDSAGRAVVFLDALSYKFLLALPTAADPPLAGDTIWTADNVSAVPQLSAAIDIEGTAGEAIADREFVYLSQGDGARTSGRWYKTDSDLSYASSLAPLIGCAQEAIASGSAGTIRLQGKITALSGLTAGTVYLIGPTAGGIVGTGSRPTNARPIGIAESTTVLVLSSWVPTMLASNLNEGIVSIAYQTFSGRKMFDQVPGFTAGVSGSAEAYVSGVIKTQEAAVGTVAGGETTLFTYTVPGNTLSTRASGTNLPSLRCTFWASFAADADNKVLKVYFGATAAQIVSAAVNLASNVGCFETILVRIDATHQALRGSGIVATDALAGGLVFAGAALPAETLANDIVFKITGQNTTDVSDNAILIRDVVLEVVG